MANPAQVIVRPWHAGVIELEEIIGSWKSSPARRINAAVGETGDLGRTGLQARPKCVPFPWLVFRR
ncbi:MAG: hypothetical protein R6U98_30190, partial [Pirellulaceae bacterium]